ncbi:MAG TPA: phospholipase D-like domain-containing protein [Tepidisphaeraceae bacterium]|jgi:cardiolipin synthase|nr:phospholipase D-like domain-containing protein [Tepidisphaeraceae bacterium]
MDVAAKQLGAFNRQASAPETKARARLGEHGTSAGINLEPGSNDDGWEIPSPVMLEDGTRVQLYKDGEALHAGYDAIKSAQKRVCLEVYIFHSDETGRAFADLLSAKAKEGVPVYVIYDSLGCIDSDPKMFAQMKAAGVRLAEFHPIKPWECKYSWRPFNRDHRKLLLLDDDGAGLGGLNVGAEYAGSWVVPSHPGCQPWRDNAVGLRGPSARLLMIAFARMWRYVNAGGKLRNTELLHNKDEGEFGILGSVPTRRSPLPSLRKMLREAKQSILLTMSYFAPPDELVEELCRAARRRVKVRLMLPGKGDVPLLITAARSFYEKLLQSGVEIYERQGAILHAKTLCIDNYISIIGSTNLDYRSIEYNCELSVILRNREFGQQVKLLFENDVCYAERITLNQWRKRPYLDRVVQWAVHRARYLL